mmetsp:Transcript_28949/g.46420  ORF Transcript_28949/g.46420 Transcript_28949/m.46420 type:complete len:290 (-) Transcript_28949:254-1123(-)
MKTLCSARQETPHAHAYAAHATGARSLASSSAVVVCTTRGGKPHMTGIMPPDPWAAIFMPGLPGAIMWWAPVGNAVGNAIPGGGDAKGMLLMKQCSWFSSLCLSCSSAALSANRPVFSFSRVSLLFCTVSRTAESEVSSLRRWVMTCAASVTMVALSVFGGLLGSSDSLKSMKRSFSASRRSFSRFDFLFFATTSPPSQRARLPSQLTSPASSEMVVQSSSASASAWPSASNAAMASSGSAISQFSREDIAPSSTASKMSASQSPESVERSILRILSSGFSFPPPFVGI